MSSHVPERRPRPIVFMSPETPPFEQRRQARPWHGRAKAALVHMGIGSVVVSAVLILVFAGWYRAPLAGASGVGPIVALLLAVDLVLGPLLTFIVFDRRKKSLKLDLAAIALLQLAGLAYGVWALDTGRPSWIVFVKDRFELVARADLRPDDLVASRWNPHAAVDVLGPRIVAAVSPSDPVEQQRAMLEAIEGGRDLQHRPDLYREYRSQLEVVRKKAQPLADLRAVHPSNDARIREAVEAAGAAEDSLAFLPVRGPVRDLAMLVSTTDGRPVALVDARPWP